MKFTNDSDYIIFYAEQLKKDNRLFEQQKKFIESQLKASSSLFRNSFKNDFKEEAREYLKRIGLISLSS